MNRVATALKEKGVSRDTITQYYSEATSGTYTNLIAISMDCLEEYDIERKTYLSLKLLKYLFRFI